MSDQTALTAPADKDPSYQHPVRDRTPLSNEETTDAMKELTKKEFIKKFPMRENFYADTPIPGQTFSLVSFVPAKGATPDKDGVYGMAKVRGSYATERECDERAEQLIRNVDSYHKIFYAYVGRPFPCTESSAFSEDINEVDIKKKISEVQSQSIKQKKKDEQKEIEEIKEREKKLLDESKRDDVEPIEQYTTLRTKKAQLSWTYIEHKKKLKEIESILIKTEKEILELEGENSEFADQFYDKYMKARRDAGLPDDDDSFIKYMVEDADLPFLKNVEVDDGDGPINDNPTVVVATEEEN